MELTGAQLAQFQQALLSAFPSKAKLAQMVSFHLDENLDAIAGGQNLSDLTFSLLQHHQAHGTLDQLLSAALTENPNNPTLQDFARALQNPTPKPIPPNATSTTFTQTSSGGTNFQTQVTGGQVHQAQTINIYHGSTPPHDTASPRETAQTPGYTENDPARRYLNNVLKKLTQNGATTLPLSETNSTLDLIAKITDFEPGLGMRGDAFFLFASFDSLTPAGLRTYSAQCLNLAQSYPTSSPGRAIFNFRVPTRCCFSVAIVQQLDSTTATTIRNNNPFKDAVDVLWYEIPVIFDLSQRQLVYYQAASDFWENFRGEIAWKKLRETIQQLLDSQG